MVSIKEEIVKIKKIYVQNYRLLKDFSLELKSDLSLIVGKNNSGKTSILSVLEKIFNKNPCNTFTWEDINLNHRKEIFENTNLDSVFGTRFLSKHTKIYDGFKS